MAESSIRVEGLWKQYTLGERTRRGPRTLRGLLSWGARGRAHEAPAFWALQDVSFEVAEGEVLGIIGSNGSGKSTLLRILCGITEPTRGWAEIRGRVGSLLEVGTGFHPELTGRDNIYLQGSILGLGYGEIRGRFDEIVAFCGLEAFLDTPVKRYSSGMYVRLAFAVAAHLEADVILVDEALAVGDASFKRRCVERMQGLAEEGRTVVFVSHELGVVESLCDRVLVIEGGRLQSQGEPAAMVSEHLGTGPGAAAADLRGRADALGAPRPLQRIELADAQGVPRTTLSAGEALRIRVGLDLPESLPGARVLVGFHSELGQLLALTGTLAEGLSLPRGGFTLEGRLEPMALTPGSYSLSIELQDRTGLRLDRVEEAIRIAVEAPEEPAWRPGHGEQALVLPSRWQPSGGDVSSG